MKPVAIAELENRKKKLEYETELLGTEVQLLHDRHAGQPDDRLVGRIDQHEAEEQGKR
jgi:hypothetical protein